jgi:hypothetical protein
MAKHTTGPNRHHYRIWLKAIFTSGLIERLPLSYVSAEFAAPVNTANYAQRLMSELRDPGSSDRTLQEILADARAFKAWVEGRRKDGLRRQLVESRPEERIIEMPPGRARADLPASQRRPSRPDEPSVIPTRTRPSRRDEPDKSLRLHPLWDQWIDALESQ